MADGRSAGRFELVVDMHLRSSRDDADLAGAPDRELGLRIATRHPGGDIRGQRVPLVFGGEHHVDSPSSKSARGASRRLGPIEGMFITSQRR